jgi:[ribosomal protein S18]-alanine N-acetyltransferase
MKMECAPIPKNRTDWSKLVNYRPALLSDLDAVMAIEEKSFRTPSSRENYMQEIEFDFYFKRVAEQRDCARIAAYSFSLVTPPEASLMTIAVRPDLRNQGLGEYLLGKILDEFRALRIAEVWLLVRTGNLAAQALYKHAGFEQKGVRPRYYPDSGEDALVLKKELR